MLTSKGDGRGGREVPAESGASCAFAASIKRAAALREGPLPFAVPVAVNLRRTRLRMPRVPGKSALKGQRDPRALPGLFFAARRERG